MKNCNCNYKDSCTCPCPEDCAISNLIANAELDSEEESEKEVEEDDEKEIEEDDDVFVDVKDLLKDRETSRKRHHNDVKAKKKSLKSADVLNAKADRLPARAPGKEIQKANIRANEARRKSNRFKKQNIAQEQKEKPYRRFQ